MSRLMSCLRHAASLVVLVLFAIVLQPLQAQTNTNQIATLRWYSAITPLSFSVQASPYGIAFDGANIWVAGQTGTLTKMRANDGEILKTVSLPGGANGVAFDGANLWVTSYPSNTVAKVRASDGVVLGTFTAGNGSSGIAFDGSNLWVANSYDNTVSKLRASDGVNPVSYTHLTLPTILRV